MKTVVLSREDQSIHILAPKVESIDTTWVGYAFTSALSNSLLDGKRILEAAALTNEFGAHITTIFGVITAWTGG